MPELTPRVAAELANEVYALATGSLMDQKLFLSRPEFSIKHQPLIAEVGFRLLNTRDAFGVCVEGGKGYEGDIFLIFRGSTKLAADWMTNFRMGVSPADTHIGFNAAFESMTPQINEFFQQLKLKSKDLPINLKRIGTIHCIGHSLGGAVASIAAKWITTHKTKNVKLYTFGAPKPGLLTFSKNLTYSVGKKNIFRCYHPTDPVPMTPLFPYVQPPSPGFGHMVPSAAGLIGSASHDMNLYVHHLMKQSWSNLERRKPPYAIESAVKLWLESKVPVTANTHQVWEWINSALIYVLTKSLGVALEVLSFGIAGAMTIADTIAWILYKGYQLGKSIWVNLLISKIMQALGMGALSDSIELTHHYLTQLMNKLMQRTYADAQKAVSVI